MTTRGFLLGEGTHCTGTRRTHHLLNPELLGPTHMLTAYYPQCPWAALNEPGRLRALQLVLTKTHEHHAMTPLSAARELFFVLR